MLSALALREPARRHAEVLIDAGGLAIAAIALVPARLRIAVRRVRRCPGIWEVVLLGAGFGLVAFGARGPLARARPTWAWSTSACSSLVVADSGDETLFWWPLVLLAIGAAMLVAGLRPRRPLPPEPDPYRAGEAPLAARADEDEVVIRVRND